MTHTHTHIYYIYHRMNTGENPMIDHLNLLLSSPKIDGRAKKRKEKTKYWCLDHQGCAAIDIHTQ